MLALGLYPLRRPVYQRPRQPGARHALRDSTADLNVIFGRPAELT
jgi:hypothetical protein